MKVNCLSSILALTWDPPLSHQVKKTPVWFHLCWKNKFNIYDVQEIGALGNHHLKINAPCVDGASVDAWPPLLLLSMREALLGQTHHFPAQHEWRWITAAVWSLKPTALFQLSQEGLSISSNLLTKRSMDAGSLMCFPASSSSINTLKNMFRWLSSFCERGHLRSLPSCLLHWKALRWFSFHCWLTECLCSLCKNPNLSNLHLNKE